MRATTAALLLFSLAACQPMAEGLSTRARAGEPHPSLAFVQGACGGCHGVEQFDLSPNADAPPFAMIANREGLSASTLTAWLRDAHNYPEEMEFDLEAGHVETLADYILTLKDPGYRPTIG